MNRQVIEDEKDYFNLKKYLTDSIPLWYYASMITKQNDDSIIIFADGYLCEAKFDDNEHIIYFYQALELEDTDAFDHPTIKMVWREVEWFEGMIDFWENQVYEIEELEIELTPLSNGHINLKKNTMTYQGEKEDYFNLKKYLMNNKANNSLSKNLIKQYIKQYDASTLIFCDGYLCEVQFDDNKYAAHFDQALEIKDANTFKVRWKEIKWIENMYDFFVDFEQNKEPSQSQIDSFMNKV